MWAFGAPGALLGVYGGWKLVDALLDRRRKTEAESELDRERKEYERLATGALKHGAAPYIEQALDELAELIAAPPEKTAAATDWVATPMSVAAAWATLSALISGKLSYDYFKKRNQRTIAQQAMRERSKERTGGLSPIYVQPVEAVV